MYQFVRRMIRGVMRSLLRRWILINRRDRYGRAGFVLPTVTMVLLVVVLLSLAITFRSFERAEDARFTRVSEQTLNAARPAIDRARAKISEALQTVTEISDEELSSTLETKLFRFADENVVQVQYDINGNNSIDTGGSLEIKQDEQIETAWRFPVDTDNNRKYDQFIVYGIFLRTPELGKPRTPLDARSLPQPSLGLSGRTECNAFSGGVDSLVTPEGLTPTRGKFKKSVFAYMINVPIDQETAQQLGEDYEATQGNSGFSPLEYQQDWQLKPLNGVVYRDDLEISPGPEFNFNGSLLTTSNLMVSHFGGGLNLYLVSAKNSCFYDPDLSKITVGGNVMNGMAGNTTAKNDVEVHLFQPEKDDPIESKISTTNQSTDTSVQDAMYNDEPYRERLENLVQAQLAQDRSNDPPEVDAVVQRRIDEEGEAIEEIARRNELERYFRARLRKIPFSEDVGENTDAGGNPLETVQKWGEVTQTDPINLTITQLEASQPTDELKKTGAENFLGDRVIAGNNLPALEFDQENNSWTQAKLVNFGTWTDTEEPRTRASQADELPAAGDLSRAGFWESAAARVPQTLVEGTGGLRVITGGSVYERASSFLPPPINPIYDDPATSATEAYPIVWPDTMPMSPAEGSQVYDNQNPGWVNLPALPLTGTNTGSIDPNTPQYAKGDLKMRATAVYHYAQDGINPAAEGNGDFEQEPIACVSSYYDPTNSNTAENDGGWPSPNGFPKSDNGIVYGPPSGGRPGGASTPGTDGLLGGGSPDALEQQANYVFPDGRFANKPLREALQKAEADRTIADKAAIDATLCSLGILGTQGYGLNASASSLPDDAIREVTLLNAREVKTVHADNPNTDVDETFTLSSPLTGADAANVDAGEYNLSLENRQPLEIRVTQLDLNLLRNATIDNTTAGIDQLNPEYFLPYSGIIYASRDDALPDRSFREGNASEGVNEDTSKALSPVDFTLDPTRRPNGILLVNGGSLGRNDNQRPTSVEDVLKEKGLTLVSNLPVYIQGQETGTANEGGSDSLQGTFNKHTQEEFEEPFRWDFGFFYNQRETVNPNFACRAGDPIREDLRSPCPNGDNWRPATVFADAITLLSDEFRLGYRNDGDFDLRNNAGNAVVGYDFNGGTAGLGNGDETSFNMDLNGDGDSNDTAVPGDEITAKVARQLNGFNAYNDFAINGLTSGIDLDDAGTEYETYTDQQYRQNQNNPLDSSYFNNFVTPVQRRGEFSEYVMEICLKLPVSACGPDDWSIDGGTTKASDKIDDNFVPATFLAGTTAQPPEPELQRFPRRIAFKRETAAGLDKNKLDLDGNLPIPLGIKDGKVIEAKFDDPDTTPDTAPNALWFQTITGANAQNWGSDNRLWYYDPADPNTSKTFTATVQQPLLVPVLQLHATTDEAGGNVGAFPEGDDAQIRTRWLPRPSRNQEFNLVLGAGDVPGRPFETNGGLQNLARFLENFQQDNSPQNSEINTTIKGSFVQSGRSSYATAPYIATKKTSNRDDAVIFGREDSPYNFNNAGRRISYFSPPARDWGFDVGLLAQIPDYFSRKFARLDKDTEGNLIVQQYFREIGRDDRWVKGLLCGKVLNENGGVQGNTAPDSIRNAMNCSDGYE